MPVNSTMAEAQTIPAESEALQRTLDSIDELGLARNLVELDAHGFTTVKGVLSETQVERAKSAILARVEKHLGREIDLDTATEEDFRGMTCVPYVLYDDEISVPGIRMSLAVYFSRQYIQTQERHGDVVPDEVRERHANDTRFLNLLAAKQPYGWQKDGPDYSKFALMPRGLYD